MNRWSGTRRVSTRTSIRGFRFPHRARAAAEHGDALACADNGAGLDAAHSRLAEVAGALVTDGATADAAAGRVSPSDAATLVRIHRSLLTLVLGQQLKDLAAGVPTSGHRLAIESGRRAGFPVVHGIELVDPAIPSQAQRPLSARDNARLTVAPH